jgi:hypothetical protein
MGLGANNSRIGNIAPILGISGTNLQHAYAIVILAPADQTVIIIVPAGEIGHCQRTTR